MFRSVDASFKEVMKRTAEDPHCLRAGTTPGLLEIFKRDNGTLEGIIKGLEEFLELKRQVFPRFYFLADDELLDLLSRSRDTAAVQPHVRKCFDAVYCLEFGEGASSTTINAMVSREGESVALGPNLKARGALEDWLRAMEENMHKVLHRLMKAALPELEAVNSGKRNLGEHLDVRPEGKIRNHARGARVEWALGGQATQVVTTVNQVLWTRGTEMAIKLEEKGEIQSLSTWLKANALALGDVVGRIQGDLTALQRRRAVALVTADVHNRDVLEALHKERVNDVQNFLWQAQLRMYWDTDTAKACQSTVEIQYGFEYQGAGTRLVITPLTERCWMTITGALDFKLGANPLGPAGTGKTESTKDLAKGLGIQCIVFNCSDQIDHAMTARLFSGLAQTGAWTCLDEFNRIDIEVLSVIAQQLMMLRQARLAASPELIFGGRSIVLKDHHVIITMNPEYAGRTELPNNLKVCFRPVAMMVPDYSLIAEIILFSEGFEGAKNLSAKVSTLARLSSEQLSQQPHYDFGMRAVKSVLVVAGQMKRAQGHMGPDAEEDVLIKALSSSNMPKLLEGDAPLFTAIMGDLFPTKSVIFPQHDDLHRGVQAATQTSGLQHSPEQEDKVDQLHETLEVRFGVALVGPAGSGKSTIYHLLAEASTWLREEELEAVSLHFICMVKEGTYAEAARSTVTFGHNSNEVTLAGEDGQQTHLSNDESYLAGEQEEKQMLITKWPQQVKVDILNPKAISVGELYGQFNPFTVEWKDGIGSSIIRRAVCVDAEVSKMYWIVFDGPIDAIWIESMNTALDDNLMLCLASGERVKLRPDGMRLLFEVEDLLQASPATVSRLGVVYVPQGCVSWRLSFQSWLEGPTLPTLLCGGGAGYLESVKSRLGDLADLVVQPTLLYMAERGGAVFREDVTTIQVQRVASMCTLLEALLLRLKEMYSQSAQGLSGHTDSQASTHVSETTDIGFGKGNNRNHGQGEGVDGAEGGFTVTTSGLGRCEGGMGIRFSPPLAVLDQAFAFSLVWGLGGGLTGDPAFAFDVHLRDLVQTTGLYSSVSLPATGTVFDHYVHFHPPGQGGIRPYEWRSWALDIPPFRYLPNVPVYEMMVPTADTELYSFLLEMNIGVGRPTFLTGASGAGKTMLSSQVLGNGLQMNPGSGETPRTFGTPRVHRRNRAGDKDVEALPDWRSHDLLPLRVHSVQVNFSARSTSQGLQSALEAKMLSVRRNLLGAPAGKTAVIFVDDVNLPARDTFGSQPPVELLRQLVSEGGFYDRDKLFWCSTRDTAVVVAAAPPGGARNTLSRRFTRLFSILCLPTQSQATMTKIFCSILEGFFSKGFLTGVSALGDALVGATLEVHKKVAREMLPTPSHPHYTFNVRDITKVMQGILLVKHQSIHTPGVMIRLWAHEMARVFGDRLADPSERVVFEHMLIEAIGRYFKMTGPGWQREDLFDIKEPKPGEEHSRGEHILLFGDVLGTGTCFTPGHFNTNGCPLCRFYEECPDLRRLVRQLTFYQDEYNLGGKGAEMSLVFFPDAVRHLLRIARILRQPRGNAILVGLAGSGRESLTQLATSMAGATMVRVNFTHNYGIQKFEEDLKKAVLVAGVEGKHVVFLVKDAQIVEEAFLEDINCLLNSGEVPNLFTPDEEADVVVGVREAVKVSGKADTPDNCKEFFVTRVRDLLHVVLCLDPAGPAFRERVRNFPSLVNCSTIDWYNAWPRSALHAVAHRILTPELAPVSTGPESCGIGPKMTAALVRASVEVHDGVKPAAAAFFSQLRRHNFVTPKSYVGFLHTFLGIIRDRRSKLKQRLFSLRDGVVKLEETGKVVEGLKRELTQLQPQLEDKANEVEDLLKQVDAERKESEAIKKKVAGDEAGVARRQERVLIVQREAQRDLDQALPALEEAIKALNSLKKDDISEVKSFQNPPQAVQTVMEAVCLLLSEGQDWESAKRVLGRSTFMDDLRGYNKDSLPTHRRKSLKRYVQDENMSVDRLRKVSLAAAGMCMWVHAMDQYADVYEEVKPKMETVKVLNKELEDANNVLRTKRVEVARIEEEVALLMQSGEEAMAEKNHLTEEIRRCVLHLERAEKLTSGLEEEKVRWSATAQGILEDEVNLTGDTFLSAAFVSYLGGFTGPFRDSLVESWAVTLRDKGIRVSEDFSVVQALGDPVVVREWHLFGLPSDKTSVESALVATNAATGRWPLLIDPQRQAYRWLKKMGEQQRNASDASETSRTGEGGTEPTPSLLCISAHDPLMLSKVETTVREGSKLLIEDVGETIDPILDPLLYRDFYTKGGRTMIKLSESEVEYNKDFRLYLMTEIPNPHFLADTAIKVNLINFNVTRRGLEEQLLGEVVKLEQPELEERHHGLVTSIASDQKQLLEIEDKILRLLNEAGSGVNILDDETLISTLSKSKTTSRAIGERLAESKSTQHQILENRDRYRPIAVRGSLLYFTVEDLSKIDTMYQYSLEYFQLLFTNCIVDTLDSGVGGLQARLNLLLVKTTEAVYRAVSRGLFERHKLLFAFLLCTSILRASGEITSIEWALLLQGPRPDRRRRTTRGRASELRGNHVVENPDRFTVDEKSWLMLQQAEQHIPAMSGICDAVAGSWTQWQDWRRDAAAHRAPLPGTWEETLNRFQKMIVIRSLSKASIHGAAADLVEHHLGRELVRPSGTAAGLDEVFADVDHKTPCIFVLSGGADPMTLLQKFAASVGMEDKLNMVSLGRGQGHQAAAIIKAAEDNGGWAILQNCHLARSWLPALDCIVKSLGDRTNDINPAFRLFLSAAPVQFFPVGVLQRSVKITDEPPRGIQANLRRSHNMHMSELLNEEEEREREICRPPEWKRLLFGLCFFHAVVQERVKFGPLGWNVTYDFADSDLSTAIKLLGRFVDNLHIDSSDAAFTKLPVDSLVYVTGNITYGGRVTDEWDRRCLLAILDHFYRASIYGDKVNTPVVGGEPGPRFRFSVSSGSSKTKAKLTRRMSASSAMIAAAPADGKSESYLSYIEQIPPEDGPQMFGMHASADISLRLKESSGLLDAVLALQPRDASAPAGQSPHDAVLAITQELMAKIPKTLQHRKEGAVNHLTRRRSSAGSTGSNSDSLMTVLVQEMDNCDRLIKIVRASLEQLVLAIKGEFVMTAALDTVCNCFLVNQVPEEWRAQGFASLKPLGSWMQDLRWRVRFFALWLERGNPYAFSLPAFFFPQGFLTAVLQNHSRKHAVPINLLSFKFEFPTLDRVEDATSHPEDGVLVYGMHIEGASWNASERLLQEPNPAETLASAPMVHFLPETGHVANPSNYVCPTYKTSDRRGKLSTTGVSSNFVVAVEFPTNIPARQFVLHGAAMLCSMDE
ncbi:unnamed protein product [Discosporangium mesarthrocarpum]